CSGGNAATPSPSPTPSPTRSPSPTPTPKPTPSPSPTLSPTPTPDVIDTPLPPPVVEGPFDLSGSQAKQGGFLIVRLPGMPDLSAPTTYFEQVGYNMSRA